MKHVLFSPRDISSGLPTISSGLPTRRNAALAPPRQRQSRQELAPGTSVYWEDKWDARGKRFKANEVSCAHRTEAFGTIFVVTNLENGKKIRCPVQDRGPYARGRVLDFSLGAARQIGCDGLCRVTVRRAGYE